jgi:hypothetical protein
MVSARFGRLLQNAPGKSGGNVEKNSQKTLFFSLLAAAILFGLSSLAYPWTLLDSPLSAYAAKVILEGGTLYKDVWDVRAPGVFFTFALQQFLLGGSGVAMRAFDVLWQLSTGLVLAHLAWLLLRRHGVGFIAGFIYLLTYFSQNYFHWAEPDTFLSLPLALACLFAVKGIASGRGVHWALAGAMVGIAALFKLPYGLFGVGLILAAIQQPRGEQKALVARLLGLAAGFATPLAACFGYFALKGGLQEFLVTQLVFAPAYVKHIHATIPVGQVLGSAFALLLVPLYAIAGIGLGGMFVSMVQRKTIAPAEKLVAFWFAVGVVTLFLQGSFLPYHYTTLYAPLAVLSAGPIHALLFESCGQRTPMRILLIAVLVISMLVAVRKLGQHAEYAWYTVAGKFPPDPWVALGQSLREKTSPQDKIFVWGNAPVLYLHSGRDSASRFLCTAYLMVPVRGVDYQGVLMRELAGNPPNYIVLVKKSAITPGLPDSLPSFEQFTLFREFVETHYQIEGEAELFILYRRRVDSFPLPPSLEHSRRKPAPM